VGNFLSRSIASSEDSGKNIGLVSSNFRNRLLVSEIENESIVREP
jgi:hypothetical protein